MRTRRTVFKTAAFIAAAALTLGAAAPLSGAFTATPTTAFAADYTEITQGGLTIYKYDDHAEIVNSDATMTSVDIRNFLRYYCTRNRKQYNLMNRPW